jgi:hypothetical protein
VHVSLTPNPPKFVRGESGAYIFNLSAQRVNISGYHGFLARIGIEVAVGATVCAERDMDVNRVITSHM